MYQTEFYVYENYVVYLRVYHVRSCSPTPTYKHPLGGCQPDEPQASLATTNRCNHVYVVLFFILLFMYAVIHCFYSVGNKIITIIISSPIAEYVIVWCGILFIWSVSSGGLERYKCRKTEQNKTKTGPDTHSCRIKYATRITQTHGPVLYSIGKTCRNAVLYITRFQQRYIQYIPRNMHTVFALLCFVVVIHWLILSYPSGLLHWHCGNLTIAPVPAKQPWWIWINTSCEFIMNDCITTTKQSTTKPCANFLGYTVYRKELW